MKKVCQKVCLKISNIYPRSHFRNVTPKSLTLHPLRFGEPERRLKCELKIFNFKDQNRTKLQAHILADFGHKIGL